MSTRQERQAVELTTRWLIDPEEYQVEARHAGHTVGIAHELGCPVG